MFAEIAVRFQYGIKRMTFLIAMTIGIATGAMRSLFAIAVVSGLLLAGGIVMLVLPGPFAAMDLLMALIGFQVGLIDCLILTLVLSSRRAASLTLPKTAESQTADHPAGL